MQKKATLLLKITHHNVEPKTMPNTITAA